MLQHHIEHHARRVKHHLRNAFIPHEGNDHRPHALRHKALTGYALAVIAVKIAVSGLLVVFPGPSATSNLTPANIVSLTNSDRTSRGLKTLKSNATLASAAQAKANDMLSKGYFAHISPTNVTPWYWFKRAGYNYSSAGENLAMDFTTAEDVNEAWLASPGHRANILNAKYVDIGVAVVSGKLNGVSTTVVVQFFAVPSAVKQQPTVVKKVTPTPPPASKKSSTVKKASDEIKQALPTPPVLGEETPTPPAVVEPLQPKITSPSSSDVIATARPWISGESESGVTIFLYYDGTSIGQTTSDEHGYFTLQPTSDIPDGQHVITTVASNAGTTSQPSAPLQVTVDTNPPSASVASLTVLPSLFAPNGYTVSGTIQGEDIASAIVRLGSSSIPLASTKGSFTVDIGPRLGDAVTDIVIEVTDTVGNISTVPVASTTFLNVEILQPETRGILALIPKLVFYSRKFFITLWLFVFLALAVNILVKIRIQHRATLLYSLLLLYGLTVAVITA